MGINSFFESYGSEKVFQGYDLSKLKRDECYITVNNTAKEQLSLFSIYEECSECDYTFERGPFEINNISTFIFNTKFTKRLRLVLNNNPDRYVGDGFYDSFGEFGIYKYHIGENNVDLETVKEEVNIYFPILTVALIYGVIFSFIPLGRYLYSKIKSKETDLDEKPAKKERVQSLDTFRGISIVLMIFVNYGHGGYPILEHAVWNGLCVGDLVFPWFLWIMGVCIPISMASSKKKNVAKSDAFRTILMRSCKLFIIGLFLGAGPYLDTMRIPGVLQRFAITYFVVASLNLFTTRNESDGCFSKRYQDILILRYQWIAMIAIVGLHTSLTFLLETPNCPSGYLGPGGSHKGGKFQNCTAGGAAGYIDELILGEHIYKNALITTIYQSKPFDPEGILGCLTSIFQVFLGVQAGMILLTYKNHKQRLLRWLAWSFVTALIGGFLAGFNKNSGWIPVNKHLWSLSFVLVTSSLANVLLSICYFIIDVRKMWSGKPFLFAGMNAILMYIGHNMTYSNFPIHWYLSSEDPSPTHFIMLVQHIWATSFWVLISYYLYKINYFFTV